ncbi:hypothetical protein AVEN_254295-1 [Araneus ventricosus]|uniref:Uncharacterized protein n=1 Tax=Araneus ventricosus TaxID=182803 RepID=A0A4Y2FD45_ARAVE|nr:hypothetical protein AVEN_254295-1 [Araneus ventricosus]
MNDAHWNFQHSLLQNPSCQFLFGPPQCRASRENHSLVYRLETSLSRLEMKSSIPVLGREVWDGLVLTVSKVNFGDIRECFANFRTKMGGKNRR